MRGCNRRRIPTTGTAQGAGIPAYALAYPPRLACLKPLAVLTTCSLSATPIYYRLAAASTFTSRRYFRRFRRLPASPHPSARSVLLFFRLFG